MTRFIRFASATLLASALALPALAQDDTASAPDCGWSQKTMGQGMMSQDTMHGGMMGSGMMQGMGSHMGDGMMAGAPGRFTEGRIAFLEAEIAPTDQQRPLFDDYAEALRTQARSMRTMHEQMMAGDQPGTYPERLEHMEQVMSARVDTLAALREAVGPLYRTLDDHQRRVFEQLMGMMM